MRELRHCLERACILDLAPMLTALELCGQLPEDKPISLSDHVATSERRHIVDALTANEGRIAETAAQLGISRKNLWEKMKKHAIRTGGGEDDA